MEEGTITISGDAMRGETTHFLHTTELRFVMRHHYRTLQYRNAVLKNGVPEWSDWKDVPMVFEQKESE